MIPLPRFTWPSSGVVLLDGSVLIFLFLAPGEARVSPASMGDFMGTWTGDLFLESEGDLGLFPITQHQTLRAHCLQNSLPSSIHRQAGDEETCPQKRGGIKGLSSGRIPTRTQVLTIPIVILSSARWNPLTGALRLPQEQNQRQRCQQQ